MTKPRNYKKERLPPLTAGDIVEMLLLDGWRYVGGTKHRAFEHPSRPGKVGVSMKWTGLKFGHVTMQGVMAQAGWSKDDVRRLYFSR
jgi:predicted RNA binding protein YcfA (HicA-like mRNA interferase family)